MAGIGGQTAEPDGLVRSGEPPFCLLGQRQEVLGVAQAGGVVRLGLGDRLGQVGLVLVGARDHSAEIEAQLESSRERLERLERRLGEKGESAGR